MENLVRRFVGSSCKWDVPWRPKESLISKQGELQHIPRQVCVNFNLSFVRYRMEVSI